MELPQAKDARKIVRTRMACITCRRSKHRCDGQAPPEILHAAPASTFTITVGPSERCSNCRAADLACEWAPKAQMGRPKKRARKADDDGEDQGASSRSASPSSPETRAVQGQALSHVAQISSSQGQEQPGALQRSFSASTQATNSPQNSLFTASPDILQDLLMDSSLDGPLDATLDPGGDGIRWGTFFSDATAQNDFTPLTERLDTGTGGITPAMPSFSNPTPPNPYSPGAQQANVATLSSLLANTNPFDGANVLAGNEPSSSISRSSSVAAASPRPSGMSAVQVQEDLGMFLEHVAHYVPMIPPRASFHRTLYAIAATTSASTEVSSSSAFDADPINVGSAGQGEEQCALRALVRVAATLGARHQLRRTSSSSSATAHFKALHRAASGDVTSLLSSIPALSAVTTAPTINRVQTWLHTMQTLIGSVHLEFGLANIDDSAKSLRGAIALAKKIGLHRFDEGLPVDDSASGRDLQQAQSQLRAHHPQMTRELADDLRSVWWELCVLDTIFHVSSNRRLDGCLLRQQPEGGVIVHIPRAQDEGERQSGQGEGSGASEALDLRVRAAAILTECLQPIAENSPIRKARFEALRTMISNLSIAAHHNWISCRADADAISARGAAGGRLDRDDKSALGARHGKWRRAGEEMGLMSFLMLQA